MKPQGLRIAILILGAGFFAAGCDNTGIPGQNSPTPDTPGDSIPPSGDQPPADVNEDPSTGGSTSRTSYRARIRNESNHQADVTLRFIRDSITVHLAFVRVLPKTVTTLTSPEPAAMVEVSGADSGGRVLTASTLMFPEIQGDIQQVEYVVSGEPLPDLSEEPRPLPDTPSSIALLQPVSDLTLRLGTTVEVQWTDTSLVPDAVVRIHLRPTGETGFANFTTLSPAIGAALDGLNDRLILVIQGINPGRYDVVAEIDDGTDRAYSVGTGRIDVQRDPGNAAPTLTLLSPGQVVERFNGEFVSVSWNDDDPDDNATITFSLVPTESATIGAGSYSIGPALAEDPDGAGMDQAVFLISNVLAGLYDLVGTITDGELTGTARSRGAIRVRPAPENDLPAMTLLAPSAPMTVELGGAIDIRWVDTDENDNARITLLLDPDVSATALDGNELLLVAWIGEDGDGAADQIRLGISMDVPLGDYSVVGVITDGIAEVVTRAPGTVHVTDPEAAEPPGEENPPTQIRRINLQQPAEPIWTRLGESFPIRLQLVNIPDTASARLFITGVNGNGEYLRAEVTPQAFRPNVESELVLPVTGGAIPNKWWPRDFTLEAEVVHDGVRYRAVAASPIWIRQEVEIRSARMINYWCWDSNLGVPASTDFFGLEIDWYGGGFGADPSDPTTAGLAGGRVEFWLANNGAIPADGLEDESHRKVLVTVQSPNTVRTDRIHYVDLLGIELEDLVGSPTQLDTALENDVYRLLAATDAVGFGTLITGPDSDPIEVCFPLPVGASVGP